MKVRGVFGAVIATKMDVGANAKPPRTSLYLLGHINIVPKLENAYVMHKALAQPGQRFKPYVRLIWN